MNHLPCDRHWHSTSGPSFSRLTPPFSTKLNFTRKKRNLVKFNFVEKGESTGKRGGGGVQTSSACDDRVYYLIFSGKG